MRLWRRLAHFPQSITQDEVICRYLYQKGHYTLSTGRVKPRAFHPPADYRTSVYRTLDLNEGAIWSLGDKHASRQGQLPIARGDLTANEVGLGGLRLEASPPPPRHADIIGWAQDKDAMMSQAQEIAASARLRVRDS